MHDPLPIDFSPRARRRRFFARQTRRAGIALMAVSLLASPAFLPAQENDRRIVESAMFNEGRAEMVLSVIGSEVGVSIVPLGRVPGERITILEENIELETLLDRIASPRGWVWWRSPDGTYNIADEAWYKANELPRQRITKVFRPDHVRASELQQAISSLLTQGIGSAQPDDRTNKLIVNDLPDVIERIERLIREIDVQLMTRVFYIRNGDVASIAQKIETYKSDPGIIEVDEKTHQIIVTDLLSNIKKMELLIDILDIGPEIVIYDVNNIGLEGRDLEDLQTIIESIRTPDLLFEINEKQGVFILEDVPEVHERVEQILESFDQPVKQVLIQGEILTTTFARQLGFGLDRALFSADPFDATTPQTGEDAVSRLTDFPFDNGFLSLTGNSLTGGVLNDQAIFQWQASFSDTETKVLLQPRLLVKSQESSRIFVGSEEPFLTTFFSDGVGGGVNNRSESQQTVTAGLTFEITPAISNSLLVEMEINIQNDNAEPVVVQGSGGDRTLIRRDRQNVETVLTIPSGQTRVIGGLITNSSSQSSSGIPFLSKIPIAGALFGRKAFNDTRNNLQLFITPTVVEDVIPRQTSEDGRRGRLVTGYDRVLGSYDPFSSSEIYFDENDEFVPESILIQPGEGADMESTIEDLLRETTPRPEEERGERTTNFDARGLGGTTGAGTGTAQQQRQPAQQQQQRSQPTQQQQRTTTQQQRPAQQQQQRPAQTQRPAQQQTPPAPRPTQNETRF